MIIRSCTTKRRYSMQGDFPTHRWSGNAPWRIGQRPTGERPMPHRGKADTARCVFDPLRSHRFSPQRDTCDTKADNHFLFSWKPHSATTFYYYTRARELTMPPQHAIKHLLTHRKAVFLVFPLRQLLFLLYLQGKMLF